MHLSRNALTCPPAVVRLSAAGLAAAVAMAAVLTSLSLVAELQSGSAVLVLDVAAALLGCALVPPLLLRRGVGAGAALGVLAALSPVATPTATMATFVVARTQPLPSAVTVAAASTVAHALRGLWRPYPGLSYGWWLLLVVAVHAALLLAGTLAQARGQLVASLRERAERAEAEQERRLQEARAAERTRIAREMHDVLAHRLSLLATYAGALEFRPDAPPEQTARAAGVVRSLTHQALDELREVIGLLRDDGEAADPPRPQPGLADLERLVAESRDAGMQVRLRQRCAASPTLTEAVGRTAYRIVQEGLTNAHRHAPGAPVTVDVRGTPGEGLDVAVVNDRPGGPVPVALGSSTGLIGVAERVAVVGGTVEHGPTADGGFRLRARLPWPA